MQLLNDKNHYENRQNKKKNAKVSEKYRMCLTSNYHIKKKCNRVNDVSTRSNVPDRMLRQIGIEFLKKSMNQTLNT